jgi:hypothetical protein
MYKLDVGGIHNQYQISSTPTPSQSRSRHVIESNSSNTPLYAHTKIDDQDAKLISQTLVDHSISI